MVALGAFVLTRRSTFEEGTGFAEAVENRFSALRKSTFEEYGGATEAELALLDLILFREAINLTTREFFSEGPGLGEIGPMRPLTDEEIAARSELERRIELFLSKYQFPDVPSSYLDSIDFQLYEENVISAYELYRTCSPELKSAASEAAGAGTPYEKARKMCEWVHDYLTHKPLGSMDALEILHAKHGTCGEYALLYVAFCRAEGLPARLVFLPWEPHFLAQVHVEGRWVLADPTYFIRHFWDKGWFYWADEFPRSYEYLNPNGRWV